MGIFRNFPYTNFHELNLDWIIKRIKELWEGVDKIDDKVDNFIAETEPTIRDEVDNWLDSHPEATTTVEDNSLDYKKLIAGTMGYVFPAMFGAVGDGVNDDTQAFIDMFARAEAEDLLVFIPKAQYKITERIFSDNERVVLNEGFYTDKKVIVSAPVVKSMMPHMVKSFERPITPFLGVMQGACYDSKRDRIIIAVVQGNDTDPAMIYAYDRDLNQVQTNLINPTSHFNDMTYNPNTDLIYIPARPNANEIYMMNPETLNIVDSFTIDDFGGIISRFSYDIDNDIYFAQGADYIKIYDSTFNWLKTINLTTQDLIDSADVPADASMLIQGSTVYKGQYIYLWTYNTISGLRPFIYLTQVDYNKSNTIKINYKFPSANGIDEAEGLFIIGDEIYITSSAGAQINVIKCNLANIIEKPMDYKIERILDGTIDTDTLTTPGMYICVSDAIAQQMPNCPVNQSFRMYVIPTAGGSYLTQFYVTRIGDVFVRYYRYDSKVWLDKGFVNFGSNNSTEVNSWKTFRNGKEITAYRSISIGQISDWTSVSGHYYKDLSTSVPWSSSESHNYFVVTASAGANTYACNFQIIGNNLNFRMISPGANTTSNMYVRLQLFAILD